MYFRIGYRIASPPFCEAANAFTLTPGQIINIPQGWWHYIVTLIDHTHLLAMFDAPTPEVILGSDILKFTLASIMARTYGIDENLWKQVIAPVKPATFIDAGRAGKSSLEPYPYQAGHGYHLYPYQSYKQLSPGYY